MCYLAFMKKIAMNPTVLLLLLLSILVIGGCASEPSSSSMSKTDSGRLAALEAEVATLKAKGVEQETAFRAELAQIRKNLEGIRELINIDRERANLGAAENAERDAEKNKLQDDMDIKAKSFVNENLDRLLDITKKLLDKMESEIDKQMDKKPDAPQQKGETI